MMENHSAQKAIAHLRQGNAMKQLMLTLLAAAILQPVAAWADDGQDAEVKYQAMLAAAKADPAATDWQALRFAYADRPSFSLFAANDGRKAIHEARAAHDWQSLLAAANKALDVVYVDGEAHMEAAVAYDQLGKPDDAKREQMIAVGIFKSMMPNGDGQSREHAFVVISITEEYELMAATRRRRVGSQALIHDAGHSYDMIEAVGPDGEKIALYFQIDHVVAAEAHMLGHR
jgi:tetratricopeptide (TPR) repeat protein